MLNSDWLFHCLASSRPTVEISSSNLNPGSVSMSSTSNPQEPCSSCDLVFMLLLHPGACVLCPISSLTASYSSRPLFLSVSHFVPGENNQPKIEFSPLPQRAGRDRSYTFGWKPSEGQEPCSRKGCASSCYWHNQAVLFKTSLSVSASDPFHVPVNAPAKVPSLLPPAFCFYVMNRLIGLVSSDIPGQNLPVPDI